MVSKLMRWFQRWMFRSQIRRLMREYSEYVSKPVHEQVMAAESLLEILGRTTALYKNMRVLVNHQDCRDDPRLCQTVVGSDILNWFSTQYERLIPKGEALPPFVPERIDEIPLETIILNESMMDAYAEATERLIGCYESIRESPDYMKKHYVNRMHNPTTQSIRAILSILNLACPAI